MQCPTWYDNFNEKFDELNDGIEFDRVYCFDWYEFSREDHHKLEILFKNLPRYLESESSIGQPHWFGVDGENPPFIWAEKEPPGLQVYGIVEKESLNKWHESFMNQIYSFPLRTD